MGKYDVIIIGGGLGGLSCGAILSREGMNVCVLEQNGVIGGCLQSFRRKGRLFDTGIHYIGSLDEGQVLNRYFRYFGILDKLSLRRMDSEGFDRMVFGDREYKYPSGFGEFEKYYISEFPHEKEGIKRLCGIIREIGATIDTDTLRCGKLSSDGSRFFSVAASDMLSELFTDRDLKNALTGNSSLYGGIEGVTSLYHYGMINNSFIESSYRVAGGSQQIADALTAVIRDNGGTLLTGKKVTAITVGNGEISGVRVNGEEYLTADKFISAIHPAVTFSLLDKTALVRKAYLTRLKSLRNSYGIFSAYLAMRPGTFPYIDHNYYFYNSGNGWDTGFDTGRMQPRTVLMSMQAEREQGPHAGVVNLLCPMDISLFDKWVGTDPEGRGEEYRKLKTELACSLIATVKTKFPDIEDAAEDIYTASPLTYHDYTGIPEGSAYGIIKDCRSPLTTLIPVKTKIPNLLLTGQNMNVHGALGVTVTSALTCAQLLGEEYIAKKIISA